MDSFSIVSSDMCPSVIDTYWTDEDIGLLLDRIRRGAGVPSNVLTDINPHMYHPSNLPDGCWYFLRLPFTKEINFGFWKAKGDACHIYSSDRVNGWRTTLEFYEGKCPNNRRTDWIMQEYKLTLNATNSPEGNGLLCRVFLCHGGSVDHGLQQNQNGENFSGHDSISPANNRKSSSLQDQRQVNLGNSEVNSLDDCFGSGDYLELKDLVVPHSSSSSSGNSSRQSVSSNEFFDFLELADLPENNEENKPKSTGHNYRIPASSAFTEVVLPPATEGTLVRSVTMDSPTESLKAGNTAPDPAAKEGKVPDQGGSKHGGQSCAGKGLPSNLKDHVVAPSSGGNSVPVEQKKGAVMKKKRRAWYLNCWPF